MAERNTDELRTLGRKKTVVQGSLGLNGTSAPLSSSFRGNGLASASYTATGIIDVVLSDAWGELESCLCGLQHDAGTYDADVKFVSYTAATKTLRFQVRKSSDGTALAPAAADDENRLNFAAFFDDGLTLS